MYQRRSVLLRGKNEPVNHDSFRTQQITVGTKIVHYGAGFDSYMKRPVPALNLDNELGRVHTRHVHFLFWRNNRLVIDLAVRRS